jgi:hypothetical protein
MINILEYGFCENLSNKRYIIVPRLGWVENVAHMGDMEMHSQS